EEVGAEVLPAGPVRGGGVLQRRDPGGVALLPACGLRVLPREGVGEVVGVLDLLEERLGELLQRAVAVVDGGVGAERLPRLLVEAVPAPLGGDVERDAGGHAVV